MQQALLAAALALTLSSAAIASPITYSVSRTIGAGTVVGTVQTDGTLGILGSSNILSWALSLTSPALAGGSDSISGTASILAGSALFASMTDLVYDFSIGSSGFGLQVGLGNAWCMASAGISCNGEATPAESIFFAVLGGPAETTARSGAVVIGSVSAVPEPATLALVGVALLAAAGTARRRASV